MMLLKIKFYFLVLSKCVLCTYVVIRTDLSWLCGEQLWPAATIQLRQLPRGCLQLLLRQLMSVSCIDIFHLVYLLYIYNITLSSCGLHWCWVTSSSIGAVLTALGATLILQGSNMVCCTLFSKDVCFLSTLYFCDNTTCPRIIVPI